MRSLLAVMAVFVAVAARAAQNPEGTEFKSEEGGFSIVFPAQPKVQQRTLKAADQTNVQVATYRVQSGEMLYVVSTSDFSQEYLKKGAATILDNARDAAVKGGKGKLVRETKLKLKQHPGREVLVQLGVEQGGADQGMMRARFYLVGGRQYSVIVHAKSEQSVTSAAADRFFKSFKLVR